MTLSNFKIASRESFICLSEPFRWVLLIRPQVTGICPILKFQRGHLFRTLPKAKTPTPSKSYSEFNTRYGRQHGFSSVSKLEEITSFYLKGSTKFSTAFFIRAAVGPVAVASRDSVGPCPTGSSPADPPDPPGSPSSSRVTGHNLQRPTARSPWPPSLGEAESTPFKDIGGTGARGPPEP